MVLALRLYPSVPINLRAAAHTTALPRGGGPDGQSPVLVRKGGGVGLATYHMHMRKDLYGDDAREFRPERWENGSLQEDIGWGYLPFSGGPRSCLGRKQSWPQKTMFADLSRGICDAGSFICDNSHHTILSQYYSSSRRKSRAFRIRAANHVTCYEPS